jgi:hypothetical protein
MSHLLDHWPGRLLTHILPLVLVISGLFAGSAWARKDLAIDDGRSGGGGSEGDPLDSNDAGGGGGSGDNYHDTGLGEAVYDGSFLSIFGRKVLLIPEFQGGTLIFRFFIIIETADGVEAYHAP